MHLPNGAVSPGCAVLGAGIAAAGLTMAAMAARKTTLRFPWRLAAAGAAVFAAQTCNVTILPGAASGHLIGGFILAWGFGAAWGAVAMAVVLTLQCLVFADGGWQALGLNIVNMAVLPCLVVWPLFKRLSPAAGPQRRQPLDIAALAVGAWASVVLSAAACAAELLSNPALLAVGRNVLTDMLGVHGLIAMIEALTAAAAAILLPWMSRPLAWVLGAAALVAAGAWGASPWPDGLEYAMGRSGLTLPDVADRYSLLSTLLGCAAVAALIRLGSLRRQAR